MRRAALLLLVAACDRNLDFVVDARAIAEGVPEGELVVDVVSSGEVLLRSTIDLDVEPVLRVPDALQAPRVYGVVAWVDVDLDGSCVPETDFSWLFEYYSAYNEDFVWEVDVAELRDVAGCYWFDELPDDLPEDTDDTDAG